MKRGEKRRQVISEEEERCDDGLNKVGTSDWERATKFVAEH